MSITATGYALGAVTSRYGTWRQNDITVVTAIGTPGLSFDSTPTQRACVTVCGNNTYWCGGGGDDRFCATQQSPACS
jgi:hypothetical protein